ncbi:MAG: aldo/keto reductase [Pseudomonadales bacterium]|nr:aldo/keto reductase [Pseudomonadales bacterium]
MQLNEYRQLGNSGLRVAPIALGTMTFGDGVGRNASRADSLRMLELYTKQGGNFIDTANIYNYGESEKIVGEFIRSDRSRYVVGTKYSMGMIEGQPNSGGNHRKNMRESVDASLRRLGTDYIDLYWLHMWEFRTPVAEVMRALDDLVCAGKVLYVAVSDTPAWKITEANTLATCRGWTSFIAMQAEYHLIDRTAERELVPMCRDQNVAIMPWSPLASGLLSGKYGRADLGAPAAADQAAGRKAGLQMAGAINERNLAVVDVVGKIAKQAGATPSQVALAWLLAQAGRPLPIVGARTIEQLTDNLDALQLTLDPAQLTELNEISRIEPGFPNKLYKNKRLRNMLLDRGTTIEGGLPNLYD